MSDTLDGIIAEKIDELERLLKPTKAKIKELERLVKATEAEIIQRRCSPTTNKPEVQTYVARGIMSFLNDPADSDFQRGYEAALRAVYLDNWGTPEMRALDRQNKLDWIEVIMSEFWLDVRNKLRETAE